MDYQQAAQYTSSLLRLGIKLGNDRFEALLARLGSPHRSLKIIHIAGTKGKGSTATFAASILRAAGYRVGLYLSPYVYDLRERIQVDGEMISQDDFARIVTDIKPHIDALAETDHGATTEFELKTAAGFVYFAEREVDYAVVEVGLGGRLDATNVIADSLVSVITNIGFDHRELLGNTLGEIAFEKAGILKPGGTCVTGIDGNEAYDVVERVSRERGVCLHRVVEGRDWRSESDHTVSIFAPRFDIEHARLTLRGRHQHANAALAVHALDRAGIELAASSIRTGLERANAPGRLEIVYPRAEPLPAIPEVGRVGALTRTIAPTPTSARNGNAHPRSLPDEGRGDMVVVVDVAHNELAGRVLHRALIEDFNAADRPLILVVGMSRGHEPAELLGALLEAPLMPALVVATAPQFRPRPAEEVAGIARALGATCVQIREPAPAAAAHAIEIAGGLGKSGRGAPLVVVTGSFFTVGELGPEVWEEIFRRPASWTRAS